MKTKLYNFNIELSWKLLNKLSQIDIDLSILIFGTLILYLTYEITRMVY